jgi:hypothetical protein
MKGPITVQLSALKVGKSSSSTPRVGESQTLLLAEFSFKHSKADSLTGESGSRGLPDLLSRRVSDSLSQRVADLLSRGVVFQLQISPPCPFASISIRTSRLC